MNLPSTTSALPLPADFRPQSAMVSSSIGDPPRVADAPGPRPDPTSSGVIGPVDPDAFSSGRQVRRGWIHSASAISENMLMSADLIYLDDSTPSRYSVRIPDAAIGKPPVVMGRSSPERSEAVTQRIADVFRGADAEQFESGRTSQFGRGLGAMISAGNGEAMAELQAWVHHPSTPPDVAAEALRTVAERARVMADRSLLRRIVEGGLTHASPLVRDGAIAGLMHIGDRASLPAIDLAIRAAVSAYEREAMEQAKDDIKGG